MKNSISFLPALGYILGAALFGWFLFFYNKSKGNDGLSKADAYISNNSSIKLKINDRKSVVTEVKGNARFLGAPSFYNNQTIFYDNDQKKYFDIEFITGDGSKSTFYTEFMAEIDKGEIITAEVNKQELADGSYGTEQKPIPIFAFTRDDAQHHKTYETFLSSDGTYPENHAATAKLHRDMIIFYLSHIKSKDDFKKMFGSNS